VRKTTAGNEPARRQAYAISDPLPGNGCTIDEQPEGAPMAATPQNLLVLMSDEHNPKIAGYAGHPIISTPALDMLAARGSRFTAAYTPSPICVPALRNRGHHVASIGKLHYRGHPEDDYGLTESLLAMPSRVVWAI
jgi:hypothetical protein